MQNPRRRMPTCIGSTTEVSMFRPRKYVTCHAAHAGRATIKGHQRGVWCERKCQTTKVCTKAGPTRSVGGKTPAPARSLE